MYYKFDYIFLFYDISEKRVNSIFKICKKYLFHYQNSVFCGEISPSNLLKLKNEILKKIDIEEDAICIIKLNKINFEKEEIGVLKKEDGMGHSIFIG